MRTLVCGAGVAGLPSARALLARGDEVRIVDARPRTESGLLIEPVPDALPRGLDLVVASPGWRPDHPLLVAAAAAGVEVIGEVELAWRLRGPDAAPWLLVTGTNGKTTTTRMLESILLAGGLHARAVGNVGVSLVDAVVGDARYDALAVEISSQQLHFTTSAVPAAAALLNIAEDHLDWHGSLSAYVAAKASVWDRAQVAVGNLDDQQVATLLDVRSGEVRRVGITLDAPGSGQLGVLDGVLVDRAFADAVELIPVADVRPGGAHNVSNALAAAALARAMGVPAAAVAAGLRDFVPDPHRNQFVATVSGVDYVDDSKATNPHAAAASLHSHPRIVWVAGGQLKGVDIEPLVAAIAPRLRGVVLLGADRALIAAAVARHAPDVPVVEVESNDDRTMVSVVAAAAGLAAAGDTVLLAPAAASYDMFTGYGQRGDRFAEAVRGLERI